jgi:hypothetical protein
LATRSASSVAIFSTALRATPERRLDLLALELRIDHGLARDEVDQAELQMKLETAVLLLAGEEERVTSIEEMPLQPDL